jgi:glycosyltransferase involved in cell wall biosynthesis
VLVLAYYFPPLGGAGVQRTLKFVKYLPAFGWLPTVVTTASHSYPAEDGSLADEIAPDVEVVRAGEIPGATFPARVFERLGLTTLAGLAAWPDGAVGWAPDAHRRALRLLRGGGFDAIFSTSSPYTTHLIARSLHRRARVPWVADFRDEWAWNPHATGAPRLLRELAVRAERRVATSADQLIFVADYFRVSGADGAHVTVIPNGVDEDDLVGIAAHPPDDRFRLTFVGTLYAEQDCAPVFEALGRLFASGAIDPARFELSIVGNNWLPPGRPSGAIAAESTGYVPHRDALAAMASATALLAYVAPRSRAPSGKLYEYLASGRPILCVARTDGGAASLVRELGAGPIAAPGDGPAIEAALLSLWNDWLEGRLGVPASVRENTLARFSRRKLAADLAGVLDTATHRG